MFKVRNGMAGILTLDLEKGSIHLQPGRSFDIEHDGGCSRKWIANNPILNRFLKQGTLILIHDSKEPVKKTVSKALPRKPIPSAVPAVKPIAAPIESPIIDDTYEEPEVEDLTESKTPVLAEEPPELDHMLKRDMIEWAIDHDLDVDESMRKSEIRQIIESSDVYWDLAQ